MVYDFWFAPAESHHSLTIKGLPVIPYAEMPSENRSFPNETKNCSILFILSGRITGGERSSSSVISILRRRQSSSSTLVDIVHYQMKISLPFGELISSSTFLSTLLYRNRTHITARQIIFRNLLTIRLAQPASALYRARAILCISVEAGVVEARSVRLVPPGKMSVVGKIIPIVQMEHHYQEVIRSIKSRNIENCPHLLSLLCVMYEKRTRSSVLT